MQAPGGPCDISQGNWTPQGPGWCRVAAAPAAGRQPGRWGAGRQWIHLLALSAVPHLAPPPGRLCHPPPIPLPLTSAAQWRGSAAPITAQALRQVSSRAQPQPAAPGGAPFLRLNELRDRPGARHGKKRLGRGIGSGTGKTAGRGHKGQKARAGNKPRLGFEGGQTPLRRRLPKRGFHAPFSMAFQEVNLCDIAQKVEEGQIDPSHVVSMKTLKDARLGGKAIRDGVKLLGRGSGSFSLPLHIEVSRVSRPAKEAVEAAGGTVTRVHYNKLGLRALLKPEWFAKKGRPIPRAARPPPRLFPLVDVIGRLPAPTTPLSLKQPEGQA